MLKQYLIVNQYFIWCDCVLENINIYINDTSLIVTGNFRKLRRQNKSPQDSNWFPGEVNAQLMMFQCVVWFIVTIFSLTMVLLVNCCLYFQLYSRELRPILDWSLTCWCTEAWWDQIRGWRDQSALTASQLQEETLPRQSLRSKKRCLREWWREQRLLWQTSRVSRRSCVLQHLIINIIISLISDLGYMFKMLITKCHCSLFLGRILVEISLVKYSLLLIYYRR